MKVIADISMSLDGFVTGPDPDLDHGLGHGGEPIHAWAVESTDALDAEILRATTQATGAVVMGRRLFDVIDGPHGWTDEMGYGAREAAGLAEKPPFFVVTHSAPDAIRLVDLSFTFVTDGVLAAIEQARDAAQPRDVFVMGGADVVRQCVDQGLVDELRLHIAPIVLGGGTPLFAGIRRRELVQRAARVTPAAAHLTFSLSVGAPAGR